MAGGDAQPEERGKAEPTRRRHDADGYQDLDRRPEPNQQRSSNHLSQLAQLRSTPFSRPGGVRPTQGQEDHSQNRTAPNWKLEIADYEIHPIENAGQMKPPSRAQHTTYYDSYHHPHSKPKNPCPAPPKARSPACRIESPYQLILVRTVHTRV